MIDQILHDVAFWHTLPADPARAEAMALIRDFWEKRPNPIPTLPYESRMTFYKTGDRKALETPYFAHRDALTAAAVLALTDPDEEAYLAYTQRMLWAICDEYSWALPAHTDGTLADDVGNVDLFNAETAMALAEICYALRERLDKVVYDRVTSEIERRIFNTFRTRVSWYERLHSNWASVCGGCVGRAMMLLHPEEFRASLPRFLHTMKNFIDGFSDEGICMEGTTYWVYGFSNFVWFADVLYSFTNGQIDLLSGEKVERIAGYLQKSFLKGNTTVSFSDGGRNGMAFDALQWYLTQKFPQSVHLLPQEVSRVWRGNVSWLPLTRSLIYAPPLDVERSLSKQNYDFPKAQQCIVNEERYSLFAKAGHNQEEHNHNDVGSFILATDRGQILCDIGAGLYTRQYFRVTMHERYSILCNSSRGHSVPLINGEEQMMGREHGGSIAHDANRIVIEMAGAYAVPALRRLTRVLEYTEAGVTLTDTFEGELDRITERFVSFFEPTVRENEVKIANVCVHFDPAEAVLCVHAEEHLDHQGHPVPVYLLDFEVRRGCSSVRFEMEIEVD
ncbi:MAG: heparinase II/III family protein [Clostridia bacterium]|nr:heparinase II/III family protein [Clostridia bacterium]